YQLSAEHLQSLKEFIDRNLVKGFIRKSNSPCSSPVLFVGKPDGKWRLCLDFHRLNAMTKRDCYTVPLIAELQDRVAGAKYYTKLDIREAYYRIRIKEGMILILMNMVLALGAASIWTWMAVDQAFTFDS